MQNNRRIIESICDNLNRLKAFSTAHTSSNKNEFLIHFNKDIYKVSLLGGNGKPTLKHLRNHFSILQIENNSLLINQLSDHLRLFKGFRIDSLEHNPEDVYQFARKLKVYDVDYCKFLEHNKNECLLEFEGENYLVATTKVVEQRELTNEHVTFYLQRLFS